MVPIRGLACALLLAFSSVTAAGEQTPVRVPQNIGVHDDVRAPIERSAAFSPTLKRQFSAIAASRVRVDVLVSPARLRGARRAETTINRYVGGFIKAEIVVPPGPDFFELLAHELEHVLEQIERVDLGTLARAGLAKRDKNGVFETMRARQAGLAAAAEVAAGLRTQNAAP